MSNPMFISFIKLKHKVTDDYTKSLKGFKSKYVAWEDMRKVMSNSKVQYSNMEFRNGAKTSTNCSHDKLTHIILDIDENVTIPEFQKMFKKFTWVLGTTKSHMKGKHGNPDAHCFRVCIEVINVSSDIDVLFRSIELVCPFVDKQTLTKTAAYLGNDGATIIYNNGKPLDLFKANELAKSQLTEESIELAKKKAKHIDSDLRDTHYGSCDLDMIKEQITFEVACDVVESLGFTIERHNKFKLRDEESTASCKIYDDGYCKDYGGDFSGDLFQLVVEYGQMNFGQSIKYIRNFI